MKSEWSSDLTENRATVFYGYSLCFLFYSLWHGRFDEVEAQVQASQEKCYRLGLASFQAVSTSSKYRGEGLGDLVTCGYVR